MSCFLLYLTHSPHSFHVISHLLSLFHQMLPWEVQICYHVRFIAVMMVKFGPRFVSFCAVWLWESIFHLTYSLLLSVLKKFHWRNIYITIFIILDIHQSLCLSALCANPTALVWHSVCLRGKCRLGARLSCYSAVCVSVIIHCWHLFHFYIDL